MSTRAYIAIGGDDRIHFLQGILTQDVAKLAEQKVQFAALLSPQGKVLHDMFLIERGDHILIDTSAAHAETLKKRLAMYKLRAKVTIADATRPSDIIPDPRHPDLPPLDAGNLLERIALAIPEFGVDIVPDSITAMDAGYDLLNGISFTKGCYVGQEVTARMHYKNIARKGFFRIDGNVTTGSQLIRNDKSIGTVTSAAGSQGIAFLKFDDVGDGAAIVDNQTVHISAPAWMQPKLRQFASNEN